VTTPALVLAGLALGAAATPHCAFMCGAPCAAIAGGCRKHGLALQAGRLAGYAAAGALAAAGVATLGAWARASSLLQPLWMLVQLAFLALGLWWLATGSMPPRLAREGAVPPRPAGDGAVPVRIVARRAGTLRAGLAGLGWVAWPCAALQGALLLAALADGAAGGALVMAAFALASAPALAATPWLWRRLRGAGVGPDGPPPMRPAVGPSATGWRVAGLALALSAGWSLVHIVQDRLAAACAT
jgi:sulfite exporter TauE/SafE